MNLKPWIITIIVMSITFLCPGAQENYASWSRYKVVTINTSGSGANVPNTVANFPTLIRLTSANADVFSQAATGGADIRFTDSTGVTRLNHQRERWDSTNQVAEFWVLVPSVAGNAGTKIRMYWGKSGAADSSNGTTVFDTANSFRAVWHLNSGSTGNELDATYNGMTMTAAGAPTSTAQGAVGPARTFDGATQYFVASSPTSVTGPLAFRTTDSYTLSAWVNPTSVTTTANFGNSIINKGDKEFCMQIYGASATKYWEMTTYTSTWKQTTSEDSTAAAVGHTVSGTSLVPTTGVWHYVVGTYTGGANGTSTPEQLFVDGVLIKTLSIAIGTAAQTATYNVFIGANPNGSGTAGTAPSGVGTGTNPRYWNGSMDELTMAHAVRDSNWIKLSYQTQVPGATCVTLGPTVSATLAPSNLTYSSNPAVYTVGIGIPNNNPTVTGTVTGYTVSPGLPTGLNINATTGVISGTPTAAAALANYVVTASNGTGSTIDTVKITVTAALVAPTNLTYSANPAVFTVNTAIPTDSPKVTGTVTAYSVSPALPAGLNFNTTTGYITGTPTAVTAAANYLVTASNSAGGTTAFVNITVNAALAPPTNLTYSTSPATYTVGAGITNNVPTVTGTVTGYTVSPSLPGGLLLNPSTGVISGTPTTMTATAKYAISASNGAGSAVDSLTITVNNPAGILSASNASFAIRMSGSSSVSFRLPGGGEGVELSIVDIWGRSVWSKTVSAAEMNGVQEITWDGLAMDGHRASAGIYVVRMKVLGANAGTSVQEKKITFSP